jgi:hypothetical protein
MYYFFGLLLEPCLEDLDLFVDYFRLFFLSLFLEFFFFKLVSLFYVYFWLFYDVKQTFFLLFSAWLFFYNFCFCGIPSLFGIVPTLYLRRMLKVDYRL